MIESGGCLVVCLCVPSSTHADDWGTGAPSCAPLGPAASTTGSADCLTSFSAMTRTSPFRSAWSGTSACTRPLHSTILTPRCHTDAQNGLHTRRVFPKRTVQLHTRGRVQQNPTSRMIMRVLLRRDPAGSRCGERRATQRPRGSQAAGSPPRRCWRRASGSWSPSHRTQGIYDVGGAVSPLAPYAGTGAGDESRGRESRE